MARSVDVVRSLFPTKSTSTSRERTNQHNYMQAARSTMTMTVVEEEGRTTRGKKKKWRLKLLRIGNQIPVLTECKRIAFFFHLRCSLL